MAHGCIGNPCWICFPDLNPNKGKEYFASHLATIAIPFESEKRPMPKLEFVDRITPELVAEAEELATKAGRLEEKIINRLHYIITFVFKLFDKENAYWYFYGAEEGELGDLWSHYTNDSISIIADNCPGDSMVILLKDGSEWGLDGDIPTRWLYEDFEQELIEGKQKFEGKEELRKKEAKVKRAQQKAEDLFLADAAKAKLTKKELAALKKVL